MTLNSRVADDQMGQYYRRTVAIADRLGKSLDFTKVMKALQRIHDGHLDPVVLQVGEFSVYLEIEVGGKSKDELLAEFQANGMLISDYAKDVMSKPAWKSGDKETVRFARAKVGDLGFTEQPTTAEICVRIKELGHSLCEPCDGPALRLALKDQPKGDYFWAAMEQITDSDSDPFVFFVRRRDGLPWLLANWTSSDYRWYLDFEFVFRLRK